MLAILYLLALLACLLAVQSLLLRAWGQPLTWHYGVTGRQPKALQRVLKGLLLASLVGSLALLPRLQGTDPAAYFAALLPARRVAEFFVGQAVALLLMGFIFAVETAGGWLAWKPRWPGRKIAVKSLLSLVSSFTVVAIEEPLFRGLVLNGLLADGLPASAAILVSAAVFSAAHFIRKMRTCWPAVGLAVLGLWLGVACYRTGALWLGMGLHSGGIVAIGIHRCYSHYRGPEWLIGTQAFPIAGVVAILVMLAGCALTWLLL